MKLSDLPPAWREIAEKQIATEDGKPAPTQAARRLEGFDSKYELIRDTELRAMQLGGLIRDYKYHPMTLRLSIGRSYTPDFMVIDNDGGIILEETKGFWREKDRIRWELAAHEFPMFVFRALTRPGPGWSIEEYKPRRR